MVKDTILSGESKNVQIMDSIANAVSDSCVPQIIPDIEPVTIDGKTVISVSVEPGKNRPYYLNSKGKENGTYIRVAGTSRQAFPEKNPGARNGRTANFVG